ncbi:hypothetical protein [Paraclostridium sordellii]|uniref:hypothetical protein n=1 Tax=Paraclostridium sordellii TaxID=1505 RepID=UPI0018976F87|nr:hypothetical protein [Paeniclostridium sordellii]
MHFNNWVYLFIGAISMLILIKLISKDEEYKLFTVIIIIIFSLIFLYWISLFLKLDEEKKLPILTSFFAPILAFSGTYLIFNLTIKKDIRKQNKEKKDKLEHKKNMLYSMLEYSIVHTRIVTKEIEKWYEGSYTTINTNSQPLSKTYKLSGKIKDDFEIMMLAKSDTDVGIFMNFFSQMDNLFRNKIKQYKIADNVIYINNWYDYLDCVSDIKDVQTITLWINFLKNSDMKSESYTYKFISNRDNISEIIKKNYPKAINEGIRGKFEITD